MASKRAAESANYHADLSTVSDDLEGCSNKYCGREHLLEWYTLKGCGCVCCADCVVTAHCTRGCGSFRCPGCDTLTDKMQHSHIGLRQKTRAASPKPTTATAPSYRHKRKRDDQKNVVTLVPPMSGVTTANVVQIAKPNKDKDPIRYYQSQTVRYRKDYTVISFCNMTEDKKDHVVTNHFPMDMKLSPEQETGLESLGFLLNYLFVTLDPMRNFVDKPPPILTSDSLFGMGNDDNSMLFRFFWAVALGTKKHLPTAEEEDEDEDDDGNGDNEYNNKGDTSTSYHKARVRAIAVVVSLVRRLNSKIPGPLQIALGSLLETHAVSQTVRHFFSNCRLSSSISTVSSKRLDKIMNVLKQGLNLPALLAGGLLIMLFDNLGFRIRGAKAGYEQFTMLKLRFVTGYQIAQQKINELSTVVKDWNERRKNVDAKEFLATDTDDDRLSERSLNTVVAMLKLAHLLPTLVQARNMLGREDRTTVFGVGVPAGYGERRPVNMTTDNQSNPVVVATEVDQAEEQSHKPTSMEINNEVIELPWSRDLAKKKTLKILCEYGAKLMGKTFREMDMTEEEFAETVFKKYGIAAVCDGSPAYGFSCLRSEVPQDFEEFCVFFGGFHLYLETFKKRGTLLADSHLRDRVWTWRPSDKSSDFFLIPSDPNQVAVETIEIHSAVIYAAIIATSNKNGGADVSAVEVVDNMIARAKEIPEVFDELIDLRLTDVLWMVRDSENTGEAGCDPEMYRTALRYLAILFVTTNAYKYVRLLADFAIYCDCASEFQMAIYDAFIFTQETVNGKRIWSDRGVEWLMRDIRAWLGKHAKPNQESLLARLALELTEKKKERLAGGKHTKSVSDDGAPKELLITQCFAFVFVDQMDRNMWGEGPIKYGKPRHEYFEKDGYWDPPANNELVEDHLFWYSVGQKRYMKYLNEFYIGTDNPPVVRPSKTVSMRCLPVLQKDVARLREADKTFLTSVNIDDLEKLGSNISIDDIRAAMTMEYEMLSDDDKADIRIVPKSHRKSLQIQCLIKIRQALAPGTLNNLYSEQQQDEASPAQVTPQERRAIELTQTFYTLTETVRSRSEYNDKYPVRSETVMEPPSLSQRSSGYVTTTEDNVDLEMEFESQSTVGGFSSQSQSMY